MIVSVTDASGNITEFYNVPLEVGKTIITLLHECENDDSNIASVEREDDQ